MSAPQIEPMHAAAASASRRSRPLRDEPSLDAARSSTATTCSTGQVWDVRRETVRLRRRRRSCASTSTTPGAVAVLALDDDGPGAADQAVPASDAHAATGRSRPGCSTSTARSRSPRRKRELAEEADLVADDWSVLVEFYTSPGGSDEVDHASTSRAACAPAAEAFARTRRGGRHRGALGAARRGRRRRARPADCSNAILSIGGCCAGARMRRAGADAVAAAADVRARACRRRATCGTSRSSAGSRRTPSPPTAAT